MTIKTTFATAAFVALLGTATVAQTTNAPAPAARTTAPVPAPSPTNAASTGTHTVNGAALENGANSFTQGQAMERLQDAGISSVTNLTKDDNGIWRGRGQYQGRSVELGLDFRGNISAR